MEYPYKVLGKRRFREKEFGKVKGERSRVESGEVKLEGKMP